MLANKKSRKSLLLVSLVTSLAVSYNIFAEKPKTMAEVEERSIQLDANYQGDLKEFNNNSNNNFNPIVNNKPNSSLGLFNQSQLASNFNNSYGNLPHYDNTDVIAELSQPKPSTELNEQQDNQNTSEIDTTETDTTAQSQEPVESNHEQTALAEVVKQDQDYANTKTTVSTVPSDPINNPNKSTNISFELISDDSSGNTASDDSKRELVLRELEALPPSERLQRLENIIEIKKNQQLERKVKSLQDEVQALNGLIESKYHQLEKAIAQQKLLYDDLDRRFTQLNNNGSGLSASNSSFGYGNNTKYAQQDLYTLAYKSIKQRDYNKAIELFNDYLNKYPKGLFCANANYWLGEIYMIQSDYSKAVDYFDTVLTNYPSNSKAADAMYKKGIVNIYLKDFSNAKKIFIEVKQKYHNTTVARLADQKLQGIENMNNES